METLIERFMDKTIEIINGSSYFQNIVLKYYSNDTKIYTSEYCIIIKEYDKIINSAKIFGNGGSTTIRKTSYCIDEDFIVLCCGNTLFSLKLFELKLNWKIKIDEATAFEIYKMNDDYIIHGEMAISRINKNGNIIWQNYGSDIFLTIDGNNDFKINGNNIYAKSFDGRKYKINYNGKDEYNE